jgi:bla regulator protein blaR1
VETLLRAGLSNAVTATFLALLVACLSRPLARRPAILHGLWLLVLIKLVTPPIYEVAIPWPMTTAPVDESVTCLTVLADQDADLVLTDRERFSEDLGLGEAIAKNSITYAPSDRNLGLVSLAAEPPIDWRRWTASAWLGGTVVMLLVSGLRIRRFQRLIRSAKPATEEEREWLETLACGMGLRRVPEIFWVRARVSPLVWPLGRPRLIIPRDLWKTLDGPQRSTLVVHELAHLKRGDHLVRFLELVVTALYWWHPLLWLIRQSLRDAEEQCCDAWVVWAFPEAAKSYAETLLDTLDFVHRSSQAEPLLASGLGKVPHLRKRLTMIMTGTTFRVLGVRGALGLLALAGVMLPVGATWAQQAQEPRQIKFDVKTDTVVAEPVVVDVRVRDDLSPAEGAANTVATVAKFVDVHLDGQDAPGDKVVVSGSRDDLIKALEARIAELKKGAAPAEAATDRIKALVHVVDGLRKTADPARQPEVSTVYLRAVKEAKATQAAGDAAEIAKLNKEVARIKGTLDSTLKELKATQEKIRKLGGDPGETPVVTWSRLKRVYKTYTYTTPVTIAGANPTDKLKTSMHEVKVMALDPAKTVGTLTVQPSRVEILEVQPAPGQVAPKVHQVEVKAVAPDRLEILERRLKALQEEVDGLKKGPK